MSRDITQEGRAVSEQQLKSLVERLERLEEERAELSTGFKEVLGEAKSAGFDPKILRLILKRRKMKASVRQEQEALLDTYESALGMA